MKGRALGFCRAVAAVAVLALLLDLAQGYALRYLLFALAALIAGVRITGEDANFSGTPFYTSLFLLLSVAVSYLAPSGAADMTGPDAFFVVLLTPVLEELFFRAALRSLPLYELSSSLVFALFHPTAILQTFILGVALAHFYKRTNSLAVSVTCHAANNALAVACGFWDIRIPTAVLAIVIAAMYIRRKDEKKIL